VTVKSRLTHELGWDNQYKLWTGTGANTLTIDRVYTARIEGHQVTESFTHPQLFVVRDLIRKIDRGEIHLQPEDKIRLLKLLRNRDIGGSFWSVRRKATASSRYVSMPKFKTTSIKAYSFNGRFLPDVNLSDLHWNSVNWPASPNQASEFALLLTKGATAINRTIPTVPEYSLALALGELYSDGLPSLVGLALFRAKNWASAVKAAGNEYLNVEFGWKPLVSDLKSLASTVQKASKLIEQYERGSGRPIGRHYEFPDERTTSMTSNAGKSLWPALDSTLFNGPVLVTQNVSTETLRRYWFEATYSYHLPSASSAVGKMKLYAVEAEKLLGLQVTPEVLWNLAPWSWLADWFFNFGDLVSNLSNLSKDDCMLRRGYIMCTNYTKSTISHPGSDLKGWGQTGVTSVTLESTAKERRRASPWGFGVTFEGFSPRQIAILTALGLSRDGKWGRE
jgi:hypothetical protein